MTSHEPHVHPPVDDDSRASESPEPARDLQATQRLWAVSAVLGLFVLFISLLLPFRENFRWAFALRNWVGAMNFLLTAVGVFVGVFLIVYAIRLRRVEQTGPEQRPQSRYVAGIVVPLLLWLLGVSAIWWSFASSLDHYSPTTPSRPCVELYRDALSIAKESPGFRMPTQDPDEGRCKINKTIFGS